MAPQTIEEIEQAINHLTLRQIEELYEWLERNHPQTLDARVESDLAAGRLDKAIDRALRDQANSHVRPL